MWLVVGNKGQLGRCLTDQLTKFGIEWTGASHSDLDITNESQVREFTNTQKFSVIINTAAWTAVDDAEDHPEEALKVNCDGPKFLAKHSKRVGARLIHISTDYVFSGDSQTPYELDTPTNPLNEYGRTKQLGESVVLKIGEGSFPIIRTAWLYSCYGKNFAKTIAMRAIKDSPVEVVADQLGQPTCARDLAKLIIEVGTHIHPPSIIHGTNGGSATWFQFAQEIYSLLGHEESLVSPIESTQFPTRARRPHYSVLDHSGFDGSGLNKMRHWKEALIDEIKLVHQAVIQEST